MQDRLPQPQSAEFFRAGAYPTLNQFEGFAEALTELWRAKSLVEKSDNTWAEATADSARGIASAALNELVVNGLAGLYGSHFPAVFLRGIKEASIVLAIDSDRLAPMVERAYHKSIVDTAAVGAQVGKVLKN